MNNVQVFPDIYFSYSQFMLFDESADYPQWSREHSAQGFTRTKSAVTFGTPLEAGEAYTRVITGAFEGTESYDRVIAVPFLCVTGRISLMAPDDYEATTIEIPPGHYRVTAAQRITGEDEQDIDLFFEPLAEPASRSEILVADEKLDPPAVLLEDDGAIRD